MATWNKQHLVKRLQSIVIRSNALISLLFAIGLLTVFVEQACNAVSVQRLQVPDLVLVEQPNVATTRPRAAATLNNNAPHLTSLAAAGQQPEAASLTTGGGGGGQFELQQQVVFECLISYDKRRDKNLIVKWHHDERNEPIFQWIPELNKRTIAPQYRAFIVPIQASSTQLNISNQNETTWNRTIEASFKLVRPTKELGGRYTCSAISSQNDDSKSKKMIVYTPPRSFTFNATRANLGAMFASQRDRLIQLTQPTSLMSVNAGQLSPTSIANGGGGVSSLPLAYRMRGLEQPVAQPQAPTTISPQMLSTIDYVNVNRARQAASTSGGGGNLMAAAPLAAHQQQQHQQHGPSILASSQARRFGLKLVCDIDQVFPVPEVSIFRLATGGRQLLGDAHHSTQTRPPFNVAADKLAKLDTRIERDPMSGLFHVQVTSVLDDEELQLIRQNQLMMLNMMTNGNATSQPQTQAQQLHQQQQIVETEIYFECLIALNNLELSRYADNRRTLIYRPVAAHLQANAYQNSVAQNMRLFEQTVGSGKAPIATSWPLLVIGLLLSICTPFYLEHLLS